MLCLDVIYYMGLLGKTGFIKYFVRVLVKALLCRVMSPNSPGSDRLTSDPTQEGAPSGGMPPHLRPCDCLGTMTHV